MPAEALLDAGFEGANGLGTQAIRPNDFVAVAAYAEQFGYIGNRDAYGEGGYETSERASNVGPSAPLNSSEPGYFARPSSRS